MKGRILKSLAALVLIAAAASAQASIIVNPATGRSGSFGWVGGLGPIDSIDGTGQTDWSITVGGASIIDFRVDDCCVSGDEFGLIVDGVATPWTSSGYVGGFFRGLADDLYLGAGTHLVSLTLTDLAPGWTFGAGFYRFSAAREAPPTTVPEPGALGLLAAGLLAVGIWRRRRGPST